MISRLDSNHYDEDAFSNYIATLIKPMQVPNIKPLSDASSKFRQIIYDYADACLLERISALQLPLTEETLARLNQQHTVEPAHEYDYLQPALKFLEIRDIIQPRQVNRQCRALVNSVPSFSQPVMISAKHFYDRPKPCPPGYYASKNAKEQYERDMLLFDSVVTVKVNSFVDRLYTILPASMIQCEHLVIDNNIPSSYSDACLNYKEFRRVLHVLTLAYPALQKLTIVGPPGWLGPREWQTTMQMPALTCLWLHVAYPFNIDLTDGYLATKLRSASREAIQNKFTQLFKITTGGEQALQAAINMNVKSMTDFQKPKTGIHSFIYHNIYY